MCEQFSWIEKDDNVIFLTSEDVFMTERGRDLQAYSLCPEDWHGHGAIRFFFNLKGGVERECTDFSTPANFPPELAEAIKAGRMWRFGITEAMLRMLRPVARAEYAKVRSTARAKYDKVRSTAWAECDKVSSAAWAEDDKVRSAAWAKCDKVYSAAWAEYNEVCSAAWARLWKTETNRVAAWQ